MQLHLHNAKLLSVLKTITQELLSESNQNCYVSLAQAALALCAAAMSGAAAPVFMSKAAAHDFLHAQAPVTYTVG